MRTGDAPRSVLVTGGARGIGLSTAQAFVAAGDRVWIADVDAERGVGAAAALRATGDVRFLSMDVASTASVQGAVAALGPDAVLDVLVSNAGIVGPVRSAIATDEDWQQVLDVNLGGTIRLARETFPLLQRSSAAAVVLVSSVTAGSRR